MDNELRNQLVEYYNVGTIPSDPHLVYILWGEKPVGVNLNEVAEIHTYILDHWEIQDAWGSMEKTDEWVIHQGLLGLPDRNEELRKFGHAPLQTNREIKSYYDDIPVGNNDFRHMISSMHDVGVAQTFHTAINAMDKTEQKHLLNLITTMGDQSNIGTTELMFLGKRIVDLLTLLEKFFTNQEEVLQIPSLDHVNFKTEE